MTRQSEWSSRGISSPRFVQHSALPIKWMEGLAFREDRWELRALSADEFRAELFNPSKLGFWCKVNAILLAPQPTLDSIFVCSIKKINITWCFLYMTCQILALIVDIFAKNRKLKSFQQLSITVCLQNYNYVILQSLLEAIF